MPGNKITMLPDDDVVAAFSLDEGKTPAALSLYATLDAGLNVIATETRLERVPVVSNLRIAALDKLQWLDAATTMTDRSPCSRTARAASMGAKLARQRGEQAVNRVDYNFAVHGDPDAADCRVEISVRQRGRRSIPWCQS